MSGCSHLRPELVHQDIEVPNERVASMLLARGGAPIKAVAAGADGVILDLEDSVPTNLKAEAREITAASIRALAAGSAPPNTRALYSLNSAAVSTSRSRFVRSLYVGGGAASTIPYSVPLRWRSKSPRRPAN